MLLTANEAAVRLGLRRAQIYALARDGILPSVKLGRMVRFDQEIMDRFIAGGGRPFEDGWRKKRGGDS